MHIMYFLCVSLISFIGNSSLVLSLLPLTITIWKRQVHYFEHPPMGVYWYFLMLGFCLWILGRNTTKVMFCPSQATISGISWCWFFQILLCWFFFYNSIMVASTSLTHAKLIEPLPKNKFGEIRSCLLLWNFFLLLCLGWWLFWPNI